MKIKGLRGLVFAPRKHPLQEVSEYVTAASRQNGVCIVETDEGIDGVVSTEGFRVRELVRLWGQAREHIEGHDPFDRGKIAHVLRRRFYWPQHILGVLDYGLWDIAGKALDQPIYKLLGATRERILAYASSLHHGTDERFVEVALQCKEMGFTAFKIHPYCKFEDDLRLVYKVRKAVGDNLTLMIDSLIYPGPYSRDEALRMGRALDELNFYWFEDPLPKTDLYGLAELTRACQVVQVRMGDRVESSAEYAEMIRRGCIDIVAGPPSFGITELMKLGALAEVNHMNMEPHDFGGGTASLHVALALSNAKYFEQAVPEGCFDTLIYPGVYQDPIRLTPDGYVEAPKGPGLGFGIDLKEAEKVAVEVY